MTHSQTLELIWKSHSFWKEKHKEACDAMDNCILVGRYDIFDTYVCERDYYYFRSAREFNKAQRLIE